MDCGYVPPSVNRSKIEKDRTTGRSSQAISCPSWAVQAKLPKAPICWKIVSWALHFAVNWKLIWEKVFHPNVCYIRRLDSKSSPGTSRNKWVLSQGHLLSICCTVVHSWNSICTSSKINQVTSLVAEVEKPLHYWSKVRVGISVFITVQQKDSRCSRLYSKPQLDRCAGIGKTEKSPKVEKNTCF